MNKVSIVTPIYKDHLLAPEFIKEIIGQNFQFEVEVVFVCDGGGVEEERYMKEFVEEQDFLKLIVLSRNFGQHIALSAGYSKAKGDFVCMMNVDMQDHPVELKKLFSEIQKGVADIVYGLRTERKDSFFKRFSSYAFNWLLNKLTGDQTPLNVATLRLMSRRFVDAYNMLSERSRYIPGLEFWLGFEKAYVPIEHHVRSSGKSSYTFARRLKMAVNSILSFSDLPLRWTAGFGMLISLAGIVVLVLIGFLKIFLIEFQPGYVSTIGVILLIGGIQIFVVGLASLYIGRVLVEVQKRPLYIIKETVD